MPTPRPKFEDVRLPVESFGLCRNYKKRGGCKVNEKRTLGGGLCVSCYDKHGEPDIED